jgi:hypothetical protein
MTCARMVEPWTHLMGGGCNSDLMDDTGPWSWASPRLRSKLKQTGPGDVRRGVQDTSSAQQKTGEFPSPKIKLHWVPEKPEPLSEPFSRSLLPAPGKHHTRTRTCTHTHTRQRGRLQFNFLQQWIKQIKEIKSSQLVLGKAYLFPLNFIF